MEFPIDYRLELFFQFEADAEEKALALREEGFEVDVRSFEGGRALGVSGAPEAMDALARRVAAEVAAETPRRQTGTVRWWKDEKGYGRITGDDGYIYFCHFSAVEMEGYKSLRQGQRVEFERVERMAAHGRAGAANVRVLPS